MKTKPETYAGNLTLPEALAQAEARDGIRFAVSEPNGAFVAVEIHGKTHIRRVAEQHGDRGSIVGSGGWMKEEHAHCFSWRPA